jgi:hypothetical protein
MGGLIIILISKTALVKWNPANIKWYESKGYIFTKWKDEFEVKVEDLIYGSNVLVKVICDGHCNGKKLEVQWYSYNKNIKDNGKYFCRDCALRSYATQNRTIIALKNGKSLEQWCIKNNRQDILDRWDYKLNDCLPSEIHKGNRLSKFYFKCPRNLHKSELKNINNLKINKDNCLNCKQCNSFAQWGIDTYGEDFLDKYWDNNKNKTSPWEISHGTNQIKMWLKCQENNEHSSYRISPSDFIRGRRCPTCNDSKGQSKIKEICKSYNLSYGSEYFFKDLKSKKGWPLKFDVPIFWDKGKTQLRMLIEFDGIQHYEWQKGMMTKKEFKGLQSRDKKKNKYCIKNKIILVRIPYWELNNNIESILTDILINNNTNSKYIVNNIKEKT